MAGEKGWPKSRKDREREWHRRLMLEAAERIFSNKGYHAATMQEIAGEAEFSVGAMYNMFENKEDLYHKLIEMRFEEYLGQIEERLKSEEGSRAKIEAVVATKLGFFETHKQFFRIFSNFSSQGHEERPGPLSREYAEKLKEYENRLADIFSQGVAEGVFIGKDPWLAVWCMEGITNAIIGRWVRTGEERPEWIDPKIVRDIIFYGILAGGTVNDT